MKINWLTFTNRYLHISLLKAPKNPVKSSNYTNGFYRFQEADKYIARQNYQGVTTYKDFVLMNQKQLQEIHVHVQEQQYNIARGIVNTDHPNATWSREFLYQTQRPDDLQNAEPYEHKTLLGFMKEAIKQRKQHHKFFLILIVAIPIYIYLFAKYWHPLRQDKRQTVVVADPKKLDTFDVVPLRKHAKQFDKRTKMFAQGVLNESQSL